MQLPCEYDLPRTGLGFLEYYSKHNVFHPGEDLNAGTGDQDCGNEARAPKNGIIEFVNKAENTGGGLGIFVIVKHPDGNYTRYAHLKDTPFSPADIGNAVNQGQLLGHVGKTGPTAYCHLHFEVFNETLAYIQRKHVYPWAFYPSGKTKGWISQHYLAPFDWLKTTQEKTDLEKGYDFLISNGLVLSSKPKDVVTIDVLGTILMRMKK